MWLARAARRTQPREPLLSFVLHTRPMATQAPNRSLVGVRAAQVQSPIIPIVGGLARSTPGTISLGQGVVSYKPPSAAIQRALQYAEGDNHLYGPVQVWHRQCISAILNVSAFSGIRISLSSLRVRYHIALWDNRSIGHL